MLTQEENRLLTQVGAGTPMGELLREYWTPALRSAALEADGAPKRVRLLGENFVAFRATDGRLGFFDEGCPHRCTSLALARNEDNALTCIFHGWKIDVSGKVVEVPSEPPERRAEFAAKVRVKHYPVREGGGIVWVYLGRRDPAPKFPEFEMTRLPESHVMPRRTILHHNWFAGFEGQLDSAHVGIMHSSWITWRPRKAYGKHDLNFSQANTAPRFELLMQPYGFREGALRPLGDGSVYIRVREVVFPYYSFIPVNPENVQFMVCCIPIDDEWQSQWYLYYRPDRPMTEQDKAEIMEEAVNDLDDFGGNRGSVDNMWHQDRKAMKEGHFTGITWSVQHEDLVVQESQGVFLDRSREYLGSSDSVIIRVRRMLLNAAREHQAGGPVPWLDESYDHSRIRPLAYRIPGNVKWSDVDPISPPDYRFEA
jgi:phthalate 4,5-dioxygenase oxygenase subunit